jgi:euchromatic histone-lysine N-methyltransferase
MGNSKEEAETDEQPLDLKPLLSLSPMFPTPPGYDVSRDTPLVYITPIFKSCSSSEHPRPAPASSAQASPVSTIPLKVTPISVRFPTQRHKDESSDEGSDEDYNPFCNKRKPPSLKRTTKKARRAADSNATDIKQRPVRRNLSKELLGWRSSSENPRESVEEAMAMFDSLRRRMLQFAEEEDSHKRADFKASVLMRQNNMRINDKKTIGPVPGVQIGDIFFYRIEMNILGLHVPTMAGIDFLPATHVGKDGRLAVSIISSGGYENDEDDTDTLVYTGHGGNSRFVKHDQKLERGNLALMNSAKKKNQIRVVRGVEDPFINSGKIYIYDGIYRIEDSWMDTAENGFNVFKYKLRREPGQPDGISVWKMAEKWKANPATREKVIMLDLSSEVENVPVCLVNDIDDVKGPSHFEYVTGVKYSRPLTRNKPFQKCKCPSMCLPGDTNCSCVQQNGGVLPYSSTGVLAKHVPMLYECSADCHCSQDCRNRVAQKGVKLNLEVFWTGDRGWGLRSWDPIRAGTFVCEYAGEVIDETNMNKDAEEDDYTFRTSFPSDKAIRYNLGAELLEGKSTDATAKSSRQLPIIISARDAGNVARFINHSCSPNLLWQAVQYDHGDDSYPHIMFFALKHIPPMTEMTYDYGIRGAPPGIKGKLPLACKLKTCLCGSTSCRGSF